MGGGDAPPARGREPCLEQRRAGPAALEARHGCPVAYFTGAIGGLMSAAEDVLKTPDGTFYREGTYEFAEAYGEAVADLADRALEGASPIALTPFAVSSVRVALPLENPLYRIARAAGVLDRFGVKVRRQKHLKLHAKLLIVDGARAQVGSMNIDRSAFDLRRELGILIEGPHVIKALRKVFEDDWDESKPYEAPDPLQPDKHHEGELPHDPHFLHE